MVFQAILLAFALAETAFAATTTGPAWAYGQFGLSPDRWGEAFPTCGNGLAQSGIDIKGSTTDVRSPIMPHYTPVRHDVELVHEGFVIQLDLAELEEEVHYNGSTWGLLQVMQRILYRQ